MNKWSNKEINILYELYPSASWFKLLSDLPDRTKIAICLKAEKLKIKRIVSKSARKVTNIEIQKKLSEIRINSKTTVKELSERSGYTIQQIYRLEREPSIDLIKLLDIAEALGHTIIIIPNQVD